MKAIKQASPILLEEVPALKNVLEAFVLNGYQFEYVGSLGNKPISSDVDVVIQTSRSDFFKSRPELLPDAKFYPGFNLASVPIPFNGKVIQLDLFFTEDIKWSKFILSGNRDRNQLLMAAVISKTRQYLDVGVWEQMNIRIPSGVWNVIKTDEGPSGVKLKKPNIISEEFTSNSPKFIFELINVPYTGNPTYEYLLSYLEKDESVMVRFHNYQNNK
jgi:hypothetical protein